VTAAEAGPVREQPHRVLGRDHDVVSNPIRGWRRTGCPARRGGHSPHECSWPSTSWGCPAAGPAP